MTSLYKQVLQEVIAAKRITESARRLINKAFLAESNTKEKKELYKEFMEPLKSICTRIWDPIFSPGTIETIKDDDFGPDFLFHFNRDAGISIPLDWKLFFTTFCDPVWRESVSVNEYVSMSRKQFYRYKDEKPHEWLWLERNVTSFDTSTFAGQRNVDAYSFANVERQEFWGYGGLRGDMISNWKYEKDYFHSKLKRGSKEKVVVFKFDSLPIHKDLTDHIPTAREKGVLF